MTSLENRAALVTGANRGMGRHYVEQLLDRGAAKVYAAARNPESITTSDPRVVPIRLDVTDSASIAETATAATDVSVLINNAGLSNSASVLGQDQSALRAEMETNLFGPLALAGAFADRIAESGGAIVNVSSVLAWYPVGMSYSVSKAALWSATESMRIELAPRGVQVLGVYVGLVDTDMASFAGDAPKSDPAEVVRQVLDGLEAGAEDVLADEFSRLTREALPRPALARVTELLSSSGLA